MLNGQNFNREVTGLCKERFGTSEKPFALCARDTESAKHLEKL